MKKTKKNTTKRKSVRKSGRRNVKRNNKKYSRKIRGGGQPQLIPMSKIYQPYLDAADDSELLINLHHKILNNFMKLNKSNKITDLDALCRHLNSQDGTISNIDAFKKIIKDIIYNIIIDDINFEIYYDIDTGSWYNSDINDETEDNHLDKLMDRFIKLYYCETD